MRMIRVEETVIGAHKEFTKNRWIQNSNKHYGELVHFKNDNQSWIVVEVSNFIKKDHDLILHETLTKPNSGKYIVEDNNEVFYTGNDLQEAYNNFKEISFTK